MLDKAQRRDAGVKLIALARQAREAVEALLGDATAAVRGRVTVDHQVIDALLDREQRATHGLAWLATYVESVRQLAAYAERMHAGGTLGEIEELLVRLGTGEYLAQIQGGIPMSQGEMVRPADLGLAAEVVAARLAGPLQAFAQDHVGHRARLVELMRERREVTVGNCGLDETLTTMREEMRKFADSEIASQAQQWHRTNSYIPLEVVAQMSELGVFGLTIPQDYGGLELGKESMCVVSEELSRG